MCDSLKKKIYMQIIPKNIFKFKLKFNFFFFFFNFLKINTNFIHKI